MLRSVTVAGLVCAALSVQAAATDLEAIYQLMEQGKVNDAAKLVQTQLKQSPNDIQLRFLQGVVATEQKKYDQAIKVFTGLTQDYPALPEPYNNLAVLYAAKGDDRKAAQVLEQAIGTNPSYATAHENLGDLYARMASDAYAKALQLDSGRQAIAPKLSLIKQIFPTSVAQTAARAPMAPVPAAPASAPQVQVAQASTAAVVAPPARAVKQAEPVQAEMVKPESTKLATQKPEVKAEQPKESSKAESTHAATKAVEAAISAWAKAWSQQNMNGYYAAYSDKFEPQGSTLAAWKVERKDRIVGKTEITVDVQDLKINVQGERAVAQFRQYYAAGGYKATTRKILRLNHEGGKWRIVREETGR